MGEVGDDDRLVARIADGDRRAFAEVMERHVVQLSASPASVAADLKVPLPREARGDRAAMERLRDDFLREYPELRGESE